MRKKKRTEALATAGSKFDLGTGGSVVKLHEVTLQDRLAPEAVVEYADRMYVGGRYAATLKVVEYPSELNQDWLKGVYNYDADLRVAMYLEPANNAQIIEEYRRQIANMEGSVMDYERRGKHPPPYLLNSLEDARGMLQALARNDFKMYGVHMMITLWADTEKDLFRLERRFRMHCRQIGLRVRSCSLEQDAAFRTTLPHGRLLVRQERELPSSVLATFFPFGGGTMLHPRGVLLGEDVVTGSLVLLDPHMFPVGHMVFIGATRSGKSYTFKSIADQLHHLHGLSLLIIDPSPGEYRDWVLSLGGAYIVLAVGTEHRINICEIQYPADPSKLDREDQSPVKLKVDFLKTAIELMVCGEGETLGAEGRALVERALYELYVERFGMTDSWEGLLDPEARSFDFTRPQLKKMPTLRDVLQIFREEPQLQSVANRMEPHVRGTMQIFAGETNVDTENRVVCFNIASIMERANPQLRRAVQFVLADFCRGRILSGFDRKVLGIDEAHLLFRTPEMAMFVSDLMRMAGKYGGIVCLMTQHLSDFIGLPGRPSPGAEYAHACLGNTYLTFVMHQDKELEVRQLQEEFTLTDAEVNWIKKQAPPGSGVLVASSERGGEGVQHVVFRGVAPGALHNWITTKPEEVQALANWRAERLEAAARIRSGGGSLPEAAVEAAGSELEQA